jgi:hypothetical protein
MGALVLLALGINSLFGGESDDDAAAVFGPANLDDDGEPLERKIDLVASVVRFELSEDWAIGTDGVTSGEMSAVLGETRVMKIAPGTPGQSSCADYTVASNCVVLADLLGEAVVWFAILPQGPNATVELPPIVDLQEGFAIFETGWQLPYPPVIERDSVTCSEDIASFSDFLRRFGPNSVSVVDLKTQQVTKVLCGAEVVRPTSDGGATGGASTTTTTATTTASTIAAVGSTPSTSEL